MKTSRNAKARNRWKNFGAPRTEFLSFFGGKSIIFHTSPVFNGTFCLYTLLWSFCISIYCLTKKTLRNQKDSSRKICKRQFIQNWLLLLFSFTISTLQHKNKTFESQEYFFTKALTQYIKERLHWVFFFFTIEVA